MRFSRIALLAFGILLIGLALLSGGAYFLMPLLLPGDQAVATNSLFFSVATLSLILGLALVLETLRLQQDKPEHVLRLPRAALWLLLIALGLLGGSVTQNSSQAAYLFPPFHVLTLVGWAGLLYSIVRSRLPQLGVEESAWQLSYGAFIATSLSAFFEILLIILFGVVILAVAGLLPQSAAWRATIQQILENPASLQDSAQLAELLLLPPVALVLVTSLAVIVPIVEESLKTLGVVALFSRQPTRNRAVAWGFLCGLGFGLIESLLNAASAGGSWVVIALIRMLTMILHALTGALMGAAWYDLLRGRRVLSFLGLFALALLLHALWNGTAVVAALLSLLAVRSGLPLIP